MRQGWGAGGGGVGGGGCGGCCGTGLISALMIAVELTDTRTPSR